MRCSRKSVGVPCLVAIAFAGLLIYCSGCGGGGDGPERFDVSGKVTFNGNAVPAGQIVFEPDAEAGNSGPAGHATISEGAFDTATDGRGTVGGPHIVRITGLSGPADSAGIKPLFREYQTKADLEKKASTASFDVPASAAEGMVISNEPPP